MNFLGIEKFYIGQFVAYPVRKGSSMWMSVGIIYKLSEKEKFYPEQQTETKVGIIIARLGDKKSEDKYTDEYDYNLYRRWNGLSKDLIFKKVTVESYNLVILDQDFLPYEVSEGLKKEVEKFLPENAKIE